MCAAAFGTLVAATAAVTLSGPVAVAGDNDREHWSGRRALKVADGETQAVRLITDRSKNRWALLARQLSQPSGAPETWRLREYRRDRETGYDWAKPAAVPGEVTWFRYDQNQHGRIAAAWIRDGGLWAGSKSALTSRSGGRTDRAVMDRTRLADEVPGADPPRVYVQPRLDGDVLIDYAGTFHEYLSRPPVSCPGCDGYPRWATTPAPTAPAGVTGRPSLALLSGREVLAFWSGDPNEPGATSLRWSRRLETPTGPAWSEPQVIAAGAYELVKIVETVRGVRLVAVGPDGEVSLFDYGAQATSGSPGFGNRRDLAGPVTTGPVSVPQVVVDGFGVLTVAWRERDQVDAGLVIWQEDRPGSQYLEQPVLVPGTPHTSAATLVAAPFGSLTVVFQPDQHRRAMQFPRAVHLPAGTRQWTDPLRLESPNPPTVAASFSVGRPRLGGDVWVAANDGAGVWVHEFDAPRPGAKVTRPGRAIQRQRTYTIGWKPTWANAVDYAVRARVSKRLGWQEVAVPEGARSKTLTRPRGERRCYQARAIMVNGFRTDWSSQRCVTVRR